MRKLSIGAIIVFAAVVGVLASLPLNAQLRDVPPTPGLLEPVATAELRGQNTVAFTWMQPLEEHAVTKFKVNVTNDFGGVSPWNAKFKASKVCTAGTCAIDTADLAGDLTQKFIAGQYTWSLRSINADGKSVAATRMFQLFPLDPFLLAEPEDDTTVSADDEVLVAWTYNADDDPVKVKVRVVDDNGNVDFSVNFPYGACSSGSCNVTTTPLKNDDYFVKVKLINKLKTRTQRADFTVAVPVR